MHPATRIGLLCAASILSVLSILPRSQDLNRGAAGSPDGELYRAIVRRVAAGESYYAAAGLELHARGYATAPAFNWRLPTLAVFQAWLPSPAWSAGVLTVLGLAMTVVWMGQTRGAGQVAVLVSAAGMLPVWLSPAAGTIHDLWAGVLLALALGLRARGLLWCSVVAAALAVLIRELALPALIVLGAVAASERRWRETAVWSGLIVGLMAILAAHYAHVAALIRPDALRNSWVTGGGWPFVIQSARAHLLLYALPAWITAAALPWPLYGLWRSRHTRSRFVVITYVVLFTAVGRSDNWYWGLLIVPLLPLGVDVPARASTPGPQHRPSPAP